MLDHASAHNSLSGLFCVEDIGDPTRGSTKNRAHGKPVADAGLKTRACARRFQHALYGIGEQAIRSSPAQALVSQ
jgi:hypothetical protein